MWGLFLTKAVFTSDRWNYVRHHLHGASDAMASTEPLWRIIAPAIGDAFPSYMFEAASLITLGLVLLGMRLNRYPWPLVVVLAFSPGVTYFLTGALRQGFALGVFMVLLPFLKRRSRDGQLVLRWWIVVAAAIPAVLIHNSTVIAAAFLLACLFIHQFSRSPGMSQRFQLVIAVPSLVLVLATTEPTETAMAAVLLQLALLVGSFLWGPLRAPWMPMLSLFLALTAAGFLLTTTGVRVLLMIGLLAPLVMPRIGKWLAILGCVIYPLLQFGVLPGYGVEINRRNGVVLSE
jgi:hypothetical protein